LSFRLKLTEESVILSDKRSEESKDLWLLFVSALNSSTMPDVLHRGHMSIQPGAGCINGAVKGHDFSSAEKPA
jgi:hypothetical protein